MIMSEEFNKKDKSLKSLKAGKIKRRFDYKAHHREIMIFMMDFMKANKGHIPTVREITEAVKLNKKTVEKHLQEVSFDNFLPMYRKFTPEVVKGLLKGAMNGRAQNAKLWFQLVEGWNEEVAIRNRLVDGDGNDIVDRNMMAEVLKMDREQRRNRIEQLQKRHARRNTD